MPKPVEYKVGGRSIFKPSQQACEPKEARPRYYYVQPLQNTPNAFAGASVYADYEIPANVGVMTEATLRFQLTFDSNAVIPALPSTPFWVDHVEVYLGSDLIETVWKHDIWNEEIAWRRIQDLDLVGLDKPKADALGDSQPADYSSYNTLTDGTFVPAEIPQNSSGNNYWFLNLPTCLRSAKPYVKGFGSRIKFRVYFPTSLVLDAGASPTLNECILIVEEAQTDASTLARLENAHRNATVDYTVLVRTRVQQTFAEGQISAGNDISIYLRGFKNKSAGVVIYATSPDAFNQGSSASMNNRFEASIYQLLDAQNNKITERLPVEWLTTYTFPDCVDSTSTTKFDASVRTQVILPFSSDFATTISKGCAYGGFRFTTLEQLVLNYNGMWKGSSNTPDVAPAGLTSQSGGVVITATSYDYAHITVTQTRHSFRME